MITYSTYSDIVSGTTLLAYSDEAIAYFNAMSPEPDDEHKEYYDTLIKAWKSAGFWDRTEFMLILAAPDNVNNAKIWVNDPSKTGTPGTGSFTAYQGYSGNNLDAGRLVIGWQGENKQFITKDSAAVILYSRTNSQSAGIDINCIETGVARIYLIARNTSDAARPAMCDDTIGTVASVTNSSGCHVLVRDGGNRILYRNGSPVDTTAVASTDVPEGVPFYIARPARQYSFVALTSKLSAAEVATATNIIEAYMDSLGIGVI